jgi:hypothetical protein
MNRLHAVLGISLLLGGCVSAGIAPPKEATGKVSEVRIVAMEPHPLGVPPGFNSVILGSGGSIETARGFALFNTVAILLEMPEASNRAGEISQSYQAVLDLNTTPELWLNLQQNYDLWHASHDPNDWKIIEAITI